MITEKLKSDSLNNKFIVPIGNDDEEYFLFLDKYSNYIGGVYIAWPHAPSGRTGINTSLEFFDKIYDWCKRENKIFNILFNMKPHDFKQGFDYNKINLDKYKNNLTQLTFTSTFLFKEKKFSGFKKGLSVNCKIDNEQQLYAYKKDLDELDYVVIDRDVNRDINRINKLIDFSNHLGIEVDIMVNEGCIPFCPQKQDHNIFITLDNFSDQKEKIEKTKIICEEFFSKNSNILKSPFITRENLKNYKSRFFKIVGRDSGVKILSEMMDYYINGKPVDVGILFSRKKNKINIFSNMLPVEFHNKILQCKNGCYKCNFCNKIYEKISKDNN